MISCGPISGVTVVSYLDDIESWDKENLMRVEVKEVSTLGEKELSRITFFLKMMEAYTNQVTRNQQVLHGLR